MPDGTDATVIKVVGSIHDIPADPWDACAGADNPFVCHAFLAALEDSGSACADTGWTPRHLMVEGADGTVLACAPAYIKTHSYGEYVFDWGWADAYERAGGRYYPKLQCAVPFTPATGPRLLLRPGAPEDLRKALVRGMVELARQSHCSSLHITFPTEPEWRLMADQGLMPRIGVQYHWINEGYASFDDFLARLSSRKRKVLRRERREVADSDVDIQVLSGDAIQDRHWDAFYRFYLSTVDKKWAHNYLTRDFFHRLHATMADKVVLVMAERLGHPVGGALNLRGADTLYGRYWGSSTDDRFLHFEACYYRAIDYAIEHGLARVEAGAQGQHKIQRGYLPTTTYSAHWIADPGLAEAIDRYLAAERSSVRNEIAELTAGSPFKVEE